MDHFASGLARIADRIYFYLICAVALAMPFHKTFVTWPLILLFFVWVFGGAYHRKISGALRNPGAWIFSGLFLLYIIAYYISGDKAEAAHDLRVKLSILIAPLVMAGMPLEKKQVRRILYCFVFACILFALIAVGFACWRLVTLHENDFFYKDLVDFSTMHPSYIGMYAAFAVVFLVFQYVFPSGTLRISWMVAAPIAFLVIFVVLLTAKTAAISLFIFLNIAWILHAKKFLRVRRVIFLSVLVNGILFAAVLIFPVTRTRFEMLYKYNKVDYTNSVDSRSQIWKAGSEMATAHLFTGVGSGDVEDSLVIRYRQNGFTQGAEEKYNAHNEYLQVLLETGLFGLLFFLFVFGWGLRKSLREKEYLYLVFLLLFLLNISSESMLKAESGVVFFAFFNSLLGLQSHSA